jgi:uncharacterized LabA/DUF88 family protein
MSISNPYVPQDRRYLFIDGGYLRQRYTEAMQKFLGVDGSLDVRTLKDQFGSYRAYFYDCANLRGTPAEVETEENRLASIAALPGFHVREGKLAGKRKRQKQVDISLAVDMLEHASRNNFGRVELLAGDSDFVPVVEAVVRMGKWVNVIYDSTSVASDLLEAADSREQIGFEYYKVWTKAGCGLPEIPALGSNLFNEPFLGFNLVQKGMHNGKMVELAKHGSGLHLLHVHSYPPKQGTHKDSEVLKRYFQAHYGEIQWQG